MFGEGSERAFTWYLEGPSSVVVNSLDDVCEWLLDCAYPLALDEASRFTSRKWPHPSEFEERRLGTCLDHSLWAWRKLVELGYDATFVVGQRARPATPDTGHAWVMFRENEVDFLLEPLARDRNTMIRPLIDVRAEYVPTFGVDRRGRTLSYAAYAHELWSDPPPHDAERPPQN